MSGIGGSQDDVRIAIHDFVAAGARDELTDDMWTNFERLLRENDEACRLYAEYVRISTLLPSILSSIPEEVPAFPDAPATPEPAVLPYYVAAPNNTWASPTSHPIASWSLAYVIATVVFAIGLTLGALVRLPSGVDTANDSRSIPKWNKEQEIVGRVSGLADCEWPDSRDKTYDRATVRVGQKYSLAAGFLELTYDSGAKVLLQGPCVYRVDSPCSGYLEVGKLTANIGARGEGRGTREVASGQWSVASDGRGERRGERGEISDEWRVASGENSGHSSPSSNPQSLIPNPLFTITTPTAIVIDLGTEFGVEVEKSGTTRSHVFKGRVQVRNSNSNSRGPTARGSSAAHSATADVDRVIELTAGQSAVVNAGRDGKVEMARRPLSQPGAFVRTMPRSAAKTSRAAANIGDRPGDLAGLGENVTYACAIDAAGRLVDYSVTVAGAPHVFYCSHNGALDVGTLRQGGGFLTNDDLTKRISVASSIATHTTRAFLHIPGKGMKDIGTLGGQASRVSRIGPANQIVGHSATAAGVPRAFVYSNGKMRDLGTLGGDRSFAADINAAGQVVGASQTAEGAVHAFVYTPGVGMKDLGSLGGKKAISWASGIDDAGRVSGCSEFKGGRTHAFYYTAHGGMVDLGDIGDGDHLVYYHEGRMNVVLLAPEMPASHDGPEAKDTAPRSPARSSSLEKKSDFPIPGDHLERRRTSS